MDANIPGAEHAEPADIRRNFDSLREIDIDYYFNYFNHINRGMASVSLNNDGQRPHHSRCQQIGPALGDVKGVQINLLSIKLATPLERGIEQHEMLAAITATSAHDLFHNEVLEVLGDAFLKFGVSLYLFQRHPDWNEGHLTTIKMHLVSNRHLCYSATQHTIGGIIKLNKFNPKEDWQPPMLKVSDLVQVKFTIQQYDSMKYSQLVTK